MKRCVTMAAAVGCMGVLVAIPATANAAQSAYYLAGTHPVGQSSEVPADEALMFISPTWVDSGHTITTVQYPRDLAPLVGTKTLDDSRDEGVRNALTLIEASYQDGDYIHLVGVSQGAIVTHLVKKALIEKYGAKVVFETLTYGDPTNPDGGLLTKLPFDLPGITRVNSADLPHATQETTVAFRYDIIADAPDASVFENPVAWANAVMGGIYYHDKYTYDVLNQAVIDQRAVITVTYYNDNGDVVPPSEATRSSTHILIDPSGPDRGMPLTQPFRDIGLAIADDKRDIKVNQFWDSIDEKVVRPVVEAGYNHGSNPAVDQRTVSTVNGEPVDLYNGAARNSTQDQPDSNNEQLKKPLKNVVKKIKTELKQVQTDAKQRHEQRQQAQQEHRQEFKKAVKDAVKKVRDSLKPKKSSDSTGSDGPGD